MVVAVLLPTTTQTPPPEFTTLIAILTGLAVNGVLSPSFLPQSQLGQGSARRAKVLHWLESFEAQHCRVALPDLHEFFVRRFSSRCVTLGSRRLLDAVEDPGAAAFPLERGGKFLLRGVDLPFMMNAAPSDCRTG